MHILKLQDGLEYTINHQKKDGGMSQKLLVGDFL